MAYSPYSPQAQEFLDKSQGILKDLFEQAAAKYQAENWRPQHSHHSSKARGCKRQDYYLIGKRHGKEEVIPPVNPGYEFIPFWTSERGKAYHDFIGKILKAAGVLAEVFDWETDADGNLINPGVLVPGLEVRINKANTTPELWALMQELNISGILDAIPIVEVDGEKQPVIAEFKTKESKTFQFKGLWQYLGIENWYDQVQLYMHFLRLPDGSQVKIAIIWVIDAGDYRYLPEEIVYYDQERVRQILLELEEAAFQAAHNEDGLPDRDPGVDFSHCKFCSFRKTICQPDLYI